LKGKIAFKVLGLKFEVEFENKDEFEYLVNRVLPDVAERIRQEKAKETEAAAQVKLAPSEAEAKSG